MRKHHLQRPKKRTDEQKWSIWTQNLQRTQGEESAREGLKKRGKREEARNKK